MTDITYICTHEGWLYLVVVVDLFSRQVVDWSMGSRIDTSLMLDALLKALWSRQSQDAVTVHSDEGRLFTGHERQTFLRDHNLISSMSRRGNCHVNAVAESFFQLLKRERIRRQVYPTRSDARADVFTHIEMFYNPKRRHGIFDIAQRLFDVTFHTEARPAWHPSVASYRVERRGELLGHFFLDPFARTGKRAGAWMSGSRPRWSRPDGTLRTALAYLITNFAAPADGEPALLLHTEVVTLFHEFGHGLHFLLSEEDVLGVSGLSGVEWDAVELPSQLMENFAWQWPILERITHNPSTDERLPKALFDKMTSARNFQVGMWLVRQIELGLFDMRLHAEPHRAQEAQAVLDEVRAEVSVLELPKFNRFQNAFSHVFAGGYAAGYYSYLWAEVLASDAWDAFEQAGVTDVSVGRRYLESILARGGSRPMTESFEAFRGRQPTIDALLRQRGLAAAPVA